MLLTLNDAQSACEKMLRWSDADDAVVSLSSEDYSHLRFAANGFTTSGRRETVSASITVWLDKKRGAAAAADLHDDTLKAAVEQAHAIARLSPVDKEYLPSLGRQSYKPTGGFLEATVTPSLTERAQAVAHIIRDCEKNKVIGAGFHHSGGVASAFAAKHGAFYYHRSSLASLSVTARTPDGRSSGFFLRNHFDITRLNTARIGREAIHKALSSQSPRELAPGVYPVILEPQAAGDFLQLSFDARSADEGRSPFSTPGGGTKLGQLICDPRLDISSDPWHPDLPASPAAQDGIPAQPVYFVRKGLLENLDYSRYWAEHQGKQPTPGPVNLIIQSTAKPATLDEMIKSMDRGLLVSRFWYIRSVDPRTALLTGLTRDGLWYVESGKIQYPVRNFRFNQSVLALLAPGNVEMIGGAERISPSETQGNGAALIPALKVKEFHFSSKSDAV